jgi:hypothetical protein
MTTSASRGRGHVLFLFASALAFVLVLATPGSIKADLPPDPIVPVGGDLTLLNAINAIPLNDVKTALDHFPVPYVVYAQAGSGPPVIVNQRAGSPVRVDADSSMTTGKGGNDIQVEVNTELTPTPHLRLDINRIGVAPFATNLKVEIAFPWDAFNSETTLPSAPNLFMGYQTTAAGGAAGGIAPATEEINFTPNVLAGTTHTFKVTMQTTGSSNPLRFLAGAFDGTNLTGVLDARAMSALVEPVPASITLGLGVSESLLSPGPGGTDSSLNVSWTASAASKVTFAYLEDQSVPTTAFSDYDSTLTVDQMPTSDVLSLHLNEAAGTITVDNTASAPIHAVTFVKRRHDGLTITGRAGDVPTHVALSVGLPGTGTLDVNANTLDLELKLVEVGGFANTAQFLGYNLGYLDVEMLDAPDLTVGYIPAGDKFGVKATNPGESIGAIQFVLGDDANLELPPTWADTTRHEFSLIDDGTHGTAAARIVHLQEATLNLNPSPTGEDYNLIVGQAAPLNAYIQTAPTSNLIPGHDVLADCHVINVPSGHLIMHMVLPDHFDYTTDPKQGIDDIGCTGHLDSLNFDVSMANLPPVFGWDFDPAGHMTVKAEDGTGPNTASVGLIAVRLWDPTAVGIPSSSGLFGVALHDARARVDQIPSFHGTWSTGGTGTAFDYHNDAATNYLGGAQLDVSTVVGLAPLAAATATSHDYGRFVDHSGGSKELAGGAFGINTFTYSSNDATRNLSVHYKANAAHQLGLTFDSDFGGAYFPTYDINAGLTVDSIPQSFDLSTNLATNFNYNASSGISSIGVLGDIDNTNDGDSGNSVHVDAGVNGLPSSAALDVDPAATGHATFTMASPIDSVHFDLTGGEGIFGTTIKQVHLSIDHIPANWTASWDPTGGSITAVGDHVNQISLIVSKELPASNDSMRAPFVAAGGAISYTSWLREIDRQWARTGAGDPNVRETDFMSRLDDIYSSTTSLGSTEDRVLYIPDGGSLKYLEVQLTNLQGGSFHSTATTASASFTDPVSGDHPVFVGIGQQNGDFLTIGLQNLPDQIDFDAVAENPGHVHFDSNEPAGRIAFYQGPLASAGEGSATKFIVVSLPSSMHLDWDFGVNGNATFTASSQVEIRFLRQDGGSRIVSAFNFQNLSLNYGIKTGDTSSGECLPLPPFTCNEYVVVVEGSASFTASPGINGMLLVYDHGSTQDANGISSPGSTYRPELSFLLKNLTSISASAGIRVCYLPLGFPPCLVGFPLPYFGFSVSADAANLDFWDNGGGPFNVLGDPDYVDNNPWNLYPLLYDESTRIDPFS